MIMENGYENFMSLIQVNQLLTFATIHNGLVMDPSAIMQHETAFINATIKSESLKMNEKFNVLKHLLKVEYKKGDKNKYKKILVLILEKLNVLFSEMQQKENTTNLENKTAQPFDENCINSWEEFVKS